MAIALSASSRCGYAVAVAPREHPLPRFDRGPLLWAAAFAWWTASGLVSAANYHQMAAADGAAVGWDHALRTSMVGSYLWAPLTVAIFWLTRRYPIERQRWRSSLGVHVAGCIALVVVRAVTIAGFNPWVGWYDRPPEFGSVLVTSFNNNLFLYWMFVGVAHALHYAHRVREREYETSRLEAQLAQARLDALRAQLHPHFLFNTLHSLSELVHRDVDAADRMIVRLSELLRRALDPRAEHEVALRDELALVAPYLEIEQMRFGDRLTVAWEVAPEALDARVPQLILQPLVENAVRHGLAARAAPGRVVIAARVAAGRLALEVRDDGVGLGHAGAPGAGVGLSNTRARLRQRYGTDHGFALTASPDGGTVAAIDIPLSRGEAAA